MVETIWWILGAIALATAVWLLWVALLAWGVGLAAGGAAARIKDAAEERRESDG